MALNPLEVVGGIAVGTGVGAAVGDVVIPKLQDFLNEQWQAHPDRPLNARDVAAAIAEGLESAYATPEEAARTGVNAERLAMLVELLDVAPGLPQLLELWRRELANEGNVEHGLKKARLERQWIPLLKQLREVRLAPADVANAVQQGFVPGAGLLPTDPGGAPPFSVPVEEVPIDTLREFASHGVDQERAVVLAQLVGLPPGVMELLTMWNRGIVTETSVEHGIREGHTKTKWTSALKQLRHAVLSAPEYASARLRGWVTKEEAEQGGALTGYSPAQMELLYLNRGRPLAPVQAYTAWARGSPGPIGAGYTRGPHPFDEQDFLTALRQSDVRTEYGPALWANRFAYPSLFQLRGAVQQGALTPARALTILHFQRYEDQDAQALVASWARAGAEGGASLTRAELAAEYEGLFITEAEYRTSLGALGYSGPALDLEVHLADARRVKRYRDAVVAMLNAQYVVHATDDQEAASALAEVGVSGAATAQLLRIWAIERRIHNAQLTAAQVKRGYKRGHITEADARARLADLGYDQGETDVLLD